MNLAITAQDTDLNAPIEARFGRARYLLIVASETGSFTVHDNAENANGLQGAGIQSAQAAVKLGAQTLLTGHVGPAGSTRWSAKAVEYAWITVPGTRSSCSRW